MKVTLAMTRQGLIRALRGRGHDLAETVEAGRFRTAHVPRKAKQARLGPRTKGRDRDVGTGG